MTMNRPDCEPKWIGVRRGQPSICHETYGHGLVPMFFWGGDCRQGSGERKHAADSNPMGVWCDLPIATTQQEKPGAV